MTLAAFTRKLFPFVLFALLVAYGIVHGEALPPPPKAYFNDFAGIISVAKRDQLNERLLKFDKETTNQVVVAVFQKMDSPLPLDEYTLRVANSWGVGQRGKNNGVTLFVFIDDRKMRIQVGSGITDILTDELSKKIIEEDLKPHFQKADFEGGLTAGVNSILGILTKKVAGDHKATK